MTRKEQLLSIINKSGSESEAKTAQLVDEIIFIEEQLVKLKELPFIVVSSKNPGIATIKKLCDAFGITLAEFFDSETFD